MLHHVKFQRPTRPHSGRQLPAITSMPMSTIKYSDSASRYNAAELGGGVLVTSLRRNHLQHHEHGLQSALNLHLVTHALPLTPQHTTITARANLKDFTRNSSLSTAYYILLTHITAIHYVDATANTKGTHSTAVHYADITAATNATKVTYNSAIQYVDITAITNISHNTKWISRPPLRSPSSKPSTMWTSQPNRLDRHTTWYTFTSIRCHLHAQHQGIKQQHKFERKGIQQ